MWVGARTGIKPIVALGNAMDDANRNLKQAVRPYGQLEDASSAAVRREVLAVCEAAFDIVTQPVVAKCSNSSIRMDNRQDIQNAETTLQKLGFFSAQAFAGVDIRVCDTPMAEGLTPDRSSRAMTNCASASFAVACSDPMSFRQPIHNRRK